MVLLLSFIWPRPLPCLTLSASTELGDVGNSERYGPNLGNCNTRCVDSAGVEVIL